MEFSQGGKVIAQDVFCLFSISFDAWRKTIRSQTENIEVGYQSEHIYNLSYLLTHAVVICDSISSYDFSCSQRSALQVIISVGRMGKLFTVQSTPAQENIICQKLS